MRIAIIQGAFLPSPPLLGGGVEKVWFSLGKEFVRQGHEVTHISRSYGNLPDSEYIDGVHHLRIPGYDTPKSGIILKVLDFAYTWRVRKLLSADYDVVITNTFWAPILLPEKYQRVSVVDVGRMPKRQMPLYYKVARLRANSNQVANAMLKELPASRHNQVMLVPNPLTFIPSVDVRLTDKKPVILYTGRIHPEKGLDLLIKAFVQTPRNYHLKIVGPWEVETGGGGAAYLNTLHQLAGDAPVEFIDPIYDIHALNKLYQEATLFVYPSVAEQGETFGLAPLEAMAWGCAPIVSNLLCFHDFIKHEENGLIFDHRSPDAVSQLTDYLARLQVDDELRTRLATKALDVRQSHSIPNIANQFLEEFEQIVSGANYKKHDRAKTTSPS